MDKQSALRHVNVRRAVRSTLVTALVNKTCAGSSVHVERDGFDESEIPYINIRHLPKQGRDQGEEVSLLIDAGIQVDPESQPLIDDCGACVNPIVQIAEDFEVEVIEQLGCVSARDCGCGAIDIEPLGLFFDPDGSLDAVRIRTKVSFIYI